APSSSSELTGIAVQ
ncbi:MULTISPECIES: colicin 10 lysis protein, partial [Bacteria]